MVIVQFKDKNFKEEEKRAKIRSLNNYAFKFSENF